MEDSHKKENGALNTILTLSGILIGAFLITKLTHQETSEESLSKESVREGNKKIEPEVKTKKVIEHIEGLNSRQQEILSVIKEKGILTPKALQDLQPEVSSRTLRRDMDALVKAKYVSQKGSTKSTFYKYIGR